MNQLEQVRDFIITAVEASVLVSPRDHGLTHEEVQEAGERVGCKRGELLDGIGQVWRVMRVGDTRLRMQRGHAHAGPRRLNADFNWAAEPDFRNPEAFEFVRTTLQRLAAEVGEAKARLAWDVLTERGAAHGLQRRDVDVAIAVLIHDEILEERDGAVGHCRNRTGWILPSQQVASRGAHAEHTLERKWMQQAYYLVQDILARRADGRPRSVDPLDAFESELASLGHDRFRAWWVQKRTELRLADDALQPVARTVLAAALAEAALFFVAPRAQASGLMKCLDLAKPRSWKFVDLIKGAKSSDPNVRAIIDERLAQRALTLNDVRQRIHAGFLIDAPEKGPIPDLHPEEARDAAQTVDLLVRRVLDWLTEQRASPATPAS